jgi:hypothetical protein
MSPRGANSQKPAKARRRARLGKVAHLPLAVREEIIRRLIDGHSQTVICRWLNKRRDVKAALRREQSGRQTCQISTNNLYEWLIRNPPEAGGRTIF